MKILDRIDGRTVIGVALLSVAVGLGLGTTPSQAADVKIGYFTTYLPSEIEATIISKIAEDYDALKVDNVELIGTDVAPAWIGLMRGDIDVLVEVDLPNQQHFLDEAEGQVKVVSEIFADAGQGFFVPRYVVDGTDAPASDLKSIDQLGKYRDLFDGKLHDEAPGWQSTKFNAIRLKAYGLDLEHLKLSDAALVAQVQRAYERKEPILFFFYHPHWLFQRYELVKLGEPDTYEQGCFAEGGSGRCPVPSFSAWVGARNDLQGRAPEFYALLQQVKLPIDEVEALLLEINQGGIALEDAAKAWIEANREEVDGWVSRATGG